MRAKKNLRGYVSRRSKSLMSGSVSREEVNSHFKDLTAYVEQQTSFLAKQLERVELYAHQNHDLLMTQRDDIPTLRSKLEALRASSDYKKIFEESEPLVSVRIATYNRAKLLSEIAIPSILAQTYQNFEIVVVGDHCTDDTEKRLKQFNDKRIRFYNLETRTLYPEDSLKRWLVVGARPANKAVELSKGTWVATIDDDDAFRHNHLETLVRLAQETKSEMVYCAQMINYSNGKNKKLFSDPPRSGDFSMMGALYLRVLSDFIKTDEQAWAAREPQDWNLCRRMLEAGVKYAASKSVTGDIYFTSFSER